MPFPVIQEAPEVEPAQTEPEEIKIDQIESSFFPDSPGRSFSGSHG